MTIWTDPVDAQPAGPEEVRPEVAVHGIAESPATSAAPASELTTGDTGLKTAAPRYNEYGWPIPSSLSADPEEARASIGLPPFDELLLEKARVISGRFPYAEVEYRNLRDAEPRSEREIHHFE